MRVLVVVALILMLVPVVAQADTLNYWGETTNSTTWNAGSTGWGQGSDTLWDYVYTIEGAGPFAPTWIWAIACPVAPVAHFEASGWTYHYYSLADGGIPMTKPSVISGDAYTEAMWDRISEVQGQAGIVWYNTGDTTSNYFHFQTNTAPVAQQYDGDSWGTSYALSGSAATPEPGSLALLGIVMAGGGFWRRRRTTRR